MIAPRTFGHWALLVVGSFCVADAAAFAVAARAAADDLAAAGRAADADASNTAPPVLVAHVTTAPAANAAALADDGAGLELELPAYARRADAARLLAALHLAGGRAFAAASEGEGWAPCVEFHLTGGDVARRPIVTAPVGPLFRLTEDFGRGTAFPFAADRGEQVVVDLGPLLDEVLSAARARRAEGPGGVRAVVVRLEVDPEGVLAVASAARGRSN